MTTKGIILQRVGDTNRFLVRLPVFETPGSGIQSVVEATQCYSPGTIDGVKTGDVVYVTFEDNNPSNPIIMGKLYLTTTNEAEAGQNILRLQVQDSAVLPLDTTIGDIKMSDVKNLLTKDMSSDIIQLLYGEVDSIYQTANKDVDPAKKFGGTWEKISESPCYIWKRTKK